MPNNSSKQLAQGAMVIALFTILMGIGFYVPLLNIIALAVAPLPFAWYSATYERSKAIFVALIGITLTLFLGGILLFALSAVLGVAGLVIGDGLRTKKSKVYLLISTSISLLFTTSLFYIISIQLFEMDVISRAFQLMREVNVKSLELSNSAPVTIKQIDEFYKYLNTIVPAAITITLTLGALILLMINLPILKRLGLAVPRFSKFKHLRLPKAVLWYYLIVLIVTLFVEPAEGTTLYIIVLNFSVVLWLLLTLQGVSFLFFLIEEKKLPKVLKGVTAILAYPLYSIILLIGVLDLGFNMREFISSKKNG